MEVGQAIDAVTGTQRLGFCSFFLLLLFLSLKILTLGCGRQFSRLAMAQRFIRFSADPQAMQQHR